MTDRGRLAHSTNRVLKRTRWGRVGAHKRSSLTRFLFDDLRMEIVTMSRAHLWLTEMQFERLMPLLPTDARGKRVCDRRVINGIVHFLRSGGRWVDAPEAHGPHKTLHNRFVRWAAKGVWVDVFQALASAGGRPLRC